MHSVQSYRLLGRGVLCDQAMKLPGFLIGTIVHDWLCLGRPAGSFLEHPTTKFHIILKMCIRHSAASMVRVPNSQ
jgi:hypothetical protein